MKVLVHKPHDTSVCIYKLNNKKIVGSFFKQKPEVGDIVMSHQARDSNFLWMYEIQSILSNRDANISKDCTYDPSNAYFELSIKNVTGDDKFEEVDNSINALY